VPQSARGIRRHIPNALTAARLVMAVLFFTLLSVERYPAAWNASGGLLSSPVAWCLVAAGLFVVAAATDALDGHLARKWKVVSVFGRVMDPVADKVLVLGAFVLLAGPTFTMALPTGSAAGLGPGAGPVAGGGPRAFQISGVHPWMAVLILARELLVTSIRAVLESQGRDFSAAMSGKLKMVVQSVCVPLVLVLLGVADCAPGSAARVAIDVSVWVTVIVSAVSGLPYVTRGWTLLHATTPAAAADAPPTALEETRP
jgi:CDP-diacylglycerol--glycerol-3-phosphate 3-phosphatidyltransferase